MLRSLLRVAFILAATALPVHAQLVEDRVPRERTIPLREQVNTEITSARYRLGPLRLFPQFRLNNIGYTNNVFGTTEEPEDDYTATLAAGVHYVLPMGRKVFLRGDVLPEYTYYHEHEQNRAFGGTYNGALLALFNRMSVEVGGEASDRVQLISSETERPAEQQVRGGHARLEIDVLPRVSIFGSGVRRSYDFEDDDDENAPPTVALFEELVRDDEAIRGGLRYKVTSFFDLSLLHEQTTSEFEFAGSERDNESNALLLGIHYDRPRFFVNLSAGKRKGEPINGSAFAPYDEPTGSYYMTYRFARPFEGELYGNRSVIYGAAPFNLFNAYFFETRNGLGLKLRGGGRLILRNFVELGSNQYPRSVLLPDNTRVEREDDVLTYGGGVTIRLYRRMALIIEAAQTDYESNIPGFDREVLRVTSMVTFKGDFPR